MLIPLDRHCRSDHLLLLSSSVSSIRMKLTKVVGDQVLLHQSTDLVGDFSRPRATLYAASHLVAHETVFAMPVTDFFNGCGSGW